MSSPLIIEGTQYTPKVHFAPDGKLSLSGKSLPEDTATFFDPLQKWVRDFANEDVMFTVRLDYLNSSSAQQLSQLLVNIKDNHFVKKCTVEWYYEADDEDCLDFGREMQDVTEFDFNFYQMSPK
jgi:hypothetical protein